MKILILTFYSDPGHSWLRVSTGFLRQFSVLGSVSHYSYKKDGYSYLEEDCDAPLFMQAAKAAGYILEIHDDSHPRNSAIRNYPRH